MNIKFAQVVVLSEIASVFQSTLNLYGFNLSYLNLIVFFALSLPFFLGLKVRVTLLYPLVLYLLFVCVKVLFQGLSVYATKVLVLLALLPFYYLLSRKISFEDIVFQCERFRLLILLIGLVYLVSWVFYGTYRNASTVMIFLMMFLGYRSLLIKVIVSIPFSLVMKTQYKFWLLCSLVAFSIRSSFLRYFILLFVAIFALCLPLFLLLLDIGWAGFSASQLSSLQERLEETRAFVNVITNNIAYIFYGWPLGTSIVSESVSERGYMHSTYLWFIGTVGFPLSIFIFSFFIFKRTLSWESLFVKMFLILSNTFTFLFLTNPFCTVLMLVNENRKKT